MNRNSKIILAFLLGLSTPVHGSTEEGFDYFVVGQTSASFIEMLARDSGNSIIVDPDLRSHVSNARYSGSVEKIFDQMRTEGSIEWFRFNTDYYVSPPNDRAMRLIRIGALDVQRITEELENANVDVKRFPILVSKNRETLTVSGPLRYLALFEGIVEALKAEIPPPTPVVSAPRQPKPAPKTTIRVRRGTELTAEVIE